MRTLRFLLRKEFKQIFRNRALFGIMLLMPTVQLIVLPWVANYEVKNIKITVVDNDKSVYAQRLVSKIQASDYFRLTDYTTDYKVALRQIEKETSDLVLEIPQGFERDLVREQSQQLLVVVNAINGVKAGLGSSYLGQILADFNADIRLQRIQNTAKNQLPSIEVVSSNWFNPYMNYQQFMVPGILVALVTMIGSYVCALNIVKEKEIGTIEQINVTPIKKYQFILGKLIPFWVIGMLVFSLGLLVIARFVYGIVPLGHLWILYAYLAIYLIAVLGLGLLISTFAETQQQAMSVAYFVIMIFMMMSGIFTSIESMPSWAYAIAKCIPITYFVEVVRMIVLIGSGFADIQFHFWVTIGFAVLLNGLAIWNYRKVN